MPLPFILFAYFFASLPASMWLGNESLTMYIAHCSLNSFNKLSVMSLMSFTFLGDLSTHITILLLNSKLSNSIVYLFKFPQRYKLYSEYKKY